MAAFPETNKRPRQIRSFERGLKRGFPRKRFINSSIQWGSHRPSRYSRQPPLLRIFFFLFLFVPPTFDDSSNIISLLFGVVTRAECFRRGEKQEKERSIRGKEEISRLVWLIAQINCHLFYQAGANLQLPPIINGTASEIASEYFMRNHSVRCASPRLQTQKRPRCVLPHQIAIAILFLLACRGLLAEARPMSSVVFYCRN